jgi:hypothetical protein
MEKQDRDFEHWFECMYPTLRVDEEEIFYHHPIEEIKCNQLGVLYFDEDQYVAYDMVSGSVVRALNEKPGEKIRVVGAKPKVIWECYHNQKLESGSHFLYLNGNSLDCTKENLLAVSKTDPITKLHALQTKAKFIYNSVEHLVKLEAKYEKRGIDKDTLYKILSIPNWLGGARKKWKGPVPKAKLKYVK